MAQNVSLLARYVSLIKSLKVQEKSFQAFFLSLLECSRVGKRTKVCKLEPPGTLIKSAYLSNMPHGCYLIKEKSYGNIKVSKIVKKWLEEH